MAKIDLDTQLYNLEGAALTNNVNGEEIPWTLGKICAHALLLERPDESLDGTVRVARFTLACQLTRGGKQEISAKDAAMLQELVGKSFTTIVVGQVWRLLDGQTAFPIDSIESDSLIGGDHG